MTSTIEFHTFVLKMPIRHPVLYAKEATSLAVLSDNRFVLGVGTSPWPDDYEIVQLPWEGRGRRFDECIEIVRGLAAGGYFEYHGEFYDFPAIKMEPVPTQPIPVLIGGHNDVQLRRAARLGHRLERDVLVVRARLGLRGRREDRLREPFALAQAGGQADAADVSRGLVRRPARAGEEPAHDGLERDDLHPLDDHRAAAQDGVVHRDRLDPAGGFSPRLTPRRLLARIERA